MCFILYSFLVSSTWIEYSDSEWKKLVENSFNLPIFALCYSPYCPHCSGLPEGFKRYDEGLGNRTDILIVTINCMKQYGCAHFHIRGTPNIALVIGNEYQYWPVSPERGPEGWDRWINQSLAPNLRRIETDEELKSAQFEPWDGGTTFYAEVKSEDDPILPILKNHSILFKHYNDTFIYRVKENIKETKLYAYRKPGCQLVFHGDTKSSESVFSFLQKYRFGALHRYSYMEYMQLPSKQKSAIYIVDKHLEEAQRHSLQKLATNECSDIIYGWGSIEQDAKFSKILNPKEQETTPYLVVQDKAKKCKWVWKKALWRAQKELIPTISCSYTQNPKTNTTSHHHNKNNNKNDKLGLSTLPEGIPKKMIIIGVFIGLFISAIIINLFRSPKEPKDNLLL